MKEPSKETNTKGTERSRSLLHKSKLESFKSFCLAEGWTDTKTKGEYEVLRMTKGSMLLIVWSKAYAKEHLSLIGNSLIMYNKFKEAQCKE